MTCRTCLGARWVKYYAAPDEPIPDTVLQDGRRVPLITDGKGIRHVVNYYLCRCPRCNVGGAELHATRRAA